MERRDFTLPPISWPYGFLLPPVRDTESFFLRDGNLAEQTDGLPFNFNPRDCGPFDAKTCLFTCKVFAETRGNRVFL